MCGIVGYIGKRQAYPILIKGLHRLEYRGYDSAGCALINDNVNLSIYKAKGKVADLEKAASGHDVSGSLGIAHTRWATHGVPSEVNAHPHLSQSGNLTLVHNGIIENYGTLRDQLRKHGYEFQSETDTEVLVQLIDYVMTKRKADLPTAVRVALKQVFGAYAIAVIDKRNPEVLVCARKSSPLAVGVVDNNEEFFLASDASPIAEYTNQIVYLEDEEVGVIERGKPLQVYDLNGESSDAEVKEVNLDLSMLDHEGFPHFMLKEIFSQPSVLRDCMRGRIVESPYSHDPQVILSSVTQHRRQLLRARRIVIVSCGTSWHAGLIGKQLIEHFCRIPVEVAYASEFRYSDPVIEPDDVVMAISQSGETADTLAAIQQAREHGALVFGIVNGVGSSIARESDTGTYIHVGPEIGVASTKAFTGQVTVLTMLALALGMAKGTVEKKEYDETIAELQLIPEKIERVLEQNEKIEKLASRFTFAHNFLYLGRGWNYPVALEGALKLKEISYIHAEGCHAAELKHGPISQLGPQAPVIALAGAVAGREKLFGNIEECRARNSPVIAVVSADDGSLPAGCSDIIRVPGKGALTVPLTTVTALQLFAYYFAKARGCEIDQPRNLAKSVTVE